MGGGGSTLAVEQGKPLDASDVDTPRGVTAKDEVKRLRGLLAQYNAEEAREAQVVSAPTFTDYMTGLFRQAGDSDNSGELKAPEVWQLVEKNLGLSEDQVRELKSEYKDESDSISVKTLGSLLSKMAEKQGEASEKDWIELKTIDNSSTFFYNIRTQESSWTKTVAPDLSEYLRGLFMQADADGSGVLSTDEFWIMIRESLQLGLNDDEIQMLQDSGDLDKSGEVSWEEFISIAPKLLQDIMANSDPSQRDWCELQGEDGSVYYYNKRTGESLWDKPAEMFVEEADAEYNNMAPGLQVFLNKWFMAADSDSSGVLTKEQFTDLIHKQLGLGWDDDKIQQVIGKYDFDADGTMSWQDFVLATPDLLKSVTSETEPSAKDWCSLPTDDDSTYYYNFRTQESTYDKPDDFES